MEHNKNRMPGAMSEEAFKEQLREEITKTVEAARSQIEQQLARMKWQQHEGEATEQIDELEGQITALDQKMMQAATGNLGVLMHLRTSLPRAVSASKQSADQTMSQGAFQLTHHLVEMNEDAIHAMQFTHDQQSAAFHTYENRSFSRIEQLAQQNGVDISGIRDVRARLQAEREEAKRNNDRVGLFRSDALLAANNVNGLVKTNAPEEEIEEAKRKAAEARERFLKEKEIEALNAGKAEGLTGDALKARGDQARTSGAKELDNENRKNTAQAGLTPEQEMKASTELSTRRTDERGNRNSRTNENSRDDTFTVKTVQSEDVTLRNREATNMADLKVGGVFDDGGFQLSETSPALDAAKKQAVQVAKQIPDTKPESDPEKHDNVEKPNVQNQVTEAKGQGASVG